MMRTKAIAWIGAGILAAAIGHACCTAYGEDPILLSNEKAIIVWNEAQKTEHFIRQASFEGEAKDFGFIVPTPTQPEIAAVEETVFEVLSRFKPRDKGNIGCSAPDSVAGAASDTKSDVEVLDVVQVGDHKATVLKATDGQAMMNWLKQNGYKTRPAMTEWLDYYTKKAWIFTALKYTGAKANVTPTKAIRLSFKTDEPHYPYKMPTDTWPKGHVRPMTLFLISSGPVTAEYVGNGNAWEAREEWNNQVDSSKAKYVASLLKLDETHMPENTHVTALLNSTNEHGYDRDLTFKTRFELPSWASWSLIGFIIVSYFYFRRRARSRVVSA
ncbi:MAG: DUF2330 domain-containing protein [Fimbriimonadaceae bacterium]|nr:DUF2330 domain-containing protein [Fimbriimonadaceae bacterium]